MRVALGKVLNGDPPTVVVTAPGVVGVGRWRGETPPMAMTDVDVELEVPGEVDWRGILVARELPGHLVPVEDEMLLRGVVQDIDQDGVLTLRIGGAVVLLDTVGEPPLDVVGEHVAVLARHTEIYPTGV
jgi:hypothetical protein